VIATTAKTRRIGISVTEDELKAEVASSRLRGRLTRRLGLVRTLPCVALRAFL
jgi:hypothetical protein